LSRRVIIMGAAGRDFHNFNVFYRSKPDYQVVAFTATQIPDIEGRSYPASIAGPLYPKGIPIFAEEDLPRLIGELEVDDVVFAYSDVSHEYVMHRASLVLANGASFVLLGTHDTQIKPRIPCIAICAVRTGSGKSQTTRAVANICRELGLKVGIVRHPMPYGDLEKQRVQRFENMKDLEKYECTIEECEEYEPHLVQGSIVYAGVDYGDILEAVQKECDVVLWDGGNNDLPFYKPNLHIVVADPLRAGHEVSYHPGEANFRSADLIIVNKCNDATPEQIAELTRRAKELNPKAGFILANSAVTVEGGERIKGKRVLVIEDGPTMTHGGLKSGAGVSAAKKYGAAEIVDPRPWLVGRLAETFRIYPDIGHVLPAMGYGEEQVHDLESTINAVQCDLVISATPIDITRLVSVKHPIIRVGYELEERPGQKVKLAEMVKQAVGK
jgi:predicted GTPase